MRNKSSAVVKVRNVVKKTVRNRRSCSSSARGTRQRTPRPAATRIRTYRVPRLRVERQALDEGAQRATADRAVRLQPDFVRVSRPEIRGRVGLRAVGKAGLFRAGYLLDLGVRARAHGCGGGGALAHELVYSRDAAYVGATNSLGWGGLGAAQWCARGHRFLHGAERARLRDGG